MSRYAKAIIAGVGTLLGTVGTWGITAAPEGIDGAEWFGLLAALGATFTTTAATYGVPNTPPPGQPPDPQISEQHDPDI